MASKGTPQLLLARLEENVEKDPSKKAFSFVASGVDGGNISKSVTYRELSEQTTALAKYLLTCTSLRKGDRYVSFDCNGCIECMGYTSCMDCSGRFILYTK